MKNQPGTNENHKNWCKQSIKYVLIFRCLNKGCTPPPPPFPHIILLSFGRPYFYGHCVTVSWFHCTPRQGKPFCLRILSWWWSMEILTYGTFNGRKLLRVLNCLTAESQGPSIPTWDFSPTLAADRPDNIAKLSTKSWGKLNTFEHTQIWSNSRF